MIQIPSALDKTETTLIAAAVETIERIGPSNAKITIEKIEDVRENKRDYILERAKKLLEGIEEKMPKTRELSENLKLQSRESKLKEYGEEKLPCGNISGNELIIVEGRADVLNLLRNNIENVIGMNGTILPKTIKELSYDKEITLFIDGDRGGRLIARNVMDNARVDFIAVAPDGKEVEELVGKEILIALRKKSSVSEFLRQLRFEERRNGWERKKIEKEEIGEEGTKKSKKETETIDFESKKNELKKLLEEVENSSNALILDKNLEVIKKSSTKSLFSALRTIDNGVIVVVSNASSSVIKAAEEKGIKAIAAKNFAYSDTAINLISL